MKALALAALVLLTVLGCSSKDDCNESECERIAEDIREAAVVRGLPTRGVCDNPNATDLRDACESLRRCNARCSD